jgi:hypothetical protein
MSSLSASEVNAGISRRALATIRQKEERATAPFASANPNKVTIVDTWCRQLALLELNSGSLFLRDTLFLNDKPECVSILLTRQELEMLVRRAKEILERE